MYICMYVWMYACMHACMHVCVYVCMYYVSMYVCMHMYMHIMYMSMHMCMCMYMCRCQAISLPIYLSVCIHGACMDSYMCIYIYISTHYTYVYIYACFSQNLPSRSRGCGVEIRRSRTKRLAFASVKHRGTTGVFSSQACVFGVTKTSCRMCICAI